MMANAEFSDLSPDAGQTMTFPAQGAQAAPPQVSAGTLSPSAGQTARFQAPAGLSPELQTDFKTLVDFMRQQQQPAGAAQQAEGVGIPKPPAGAATFDMSQPRQQFASLPNATKSAVLGALGRLLTAGAQRLAGGAAGAALPARAANAQEPADLAKAGLGTGAKRVQMQDWDKPKETPAADSEKPSGAGDHPTGWKPPTSDKPSAEKHDRASFDRAFAAARKAKGPGKTFKWNGKTYTTDLASEMKRKGPKALIPGDNSADALNANELLRQRGQT